MSVAVNTCIKCSSFTLIVFLSAFSNHQHGAISSVAESLDAKKSIFAYRHRNNLNIKCCKL